MNVNGHKTGTPADVLRWPGRVVSAVDLARHLNGHRRLLLPRRAILTPDALEVLQQRGVLVERESEPSPVGPGWGCGQDAPYATLGHALQALEREGLHFQVLVESNGPAWAGNVAQRVAGAEYRGAVLFCTNPALLCCVANKVPGLRAAAISTLGQLALVLPTLAPNVIAVEMPGRTFFEVRQILRTVGTARTCPENVAGMLKELDGHAHR